jgi:ketosteroid isomerase-like protein
MRSISANADEEAIRAVLKRLEDGWRHQHFAGLDSCFASDAVIVGPGGMVYAAGGAACAESYREFAANAEVLEYSESEHALRIWPGTAIYTFKWQMAYAREAGAKRECGTDELVLSIVDGEWRIVYRNIHFETGVANDQAS